eukprot:5233843-Prymnesium_polylepis.1
MIVVRFSADGAASIERLEEKQLEKHAGGPKAGPVGLMAAAPSGGVQEPITMPPGLGLDAVAKLSRIEKRQRRNAARLRAFQEERSSRECRSNRQAERQQEGAHTRPVAEPCAVTGPAAARPLAPG